MRVCGGVSTWSVTDVNVVQAYVMKCIIKLARVNTEKTLNRDSVVVSCWSKPRPKIGIGPNKTRNEVGEIRSAFSSPTPDGNENAPARAVTWPKLITNDFM